MVIYVGIFILIAGVFGNGMNIYIFSSVHNYRTTPATFYVLIESIFKNIFLIINLTPRIVTSAYGFDLTRISLIWCKLRQYILQVSSTISITCACLAIIDQFLTTSPHASRRQMSKIQWAHRIVFIVILIWFLQGILFYLYYNISPITNTCGPGNPTFALYDAIYFIVIITLIPASIMMIFGVLIYRHIQQTTVLAEQHADRQLKKMILIQVVLIFICITPIGIFNTYSVITDGIVKNDDQQEKEYFAATIINLYTTFYFAVCLYLN